MLALLISAAETPPDDEVVAGWTAFWIFVALAVATAVLMRSFIKQLRKTKANADRGVFGDEPVAPEETTDEAATDDEHRATNGS